jgi:hypothetical protein
VGSDGLPVSWALGDRERQKYNDFFAMADLDKDGVVSGAEAKVFFEKSGLSAKQLHEIWYAHLSGVSTRQFALIRWLLVHLCSSHCDFRFVYAHQDAV